jgi:hypothetical protein
MVSALALPVPCPEAAPEQCVTDVSSMGVGPQEVKRGYLRRRRKLRQQLIGASHATATATAIATTIDNVVFAGVHELPDVSLRLNQC